MAHRLRPSRRDKFRRPMIRTRCQSSVDEPTSGSPDLQSSLVSISNGQEQSEQPSQIQISGHLDPQDPALVFNNDLLPDHTLSNGLTWPISRSPGQQLSTLSTPGAESSVPRYKSANREAGYLGDTGFMQMYSPEAHLASANPPIPSTQEDNRVQFHDLPPPEIQQSYLETYFEYCFPWGPVLDVDDVQTDLARSPLLVNALSLAGSRVRPPLIEHTEPVVYYDRAKRLFYNDDEPNLITSLQAIILLYWWSPRAPTVVHRDSTWWWTGIAIRQAQQLGLHRQPKPDQPAPGGASPGLLRRIWWTLFVSHCLPVPFCLV